MNIFDTLGAKVQRVLTNTLTRQGFISPLVIYKHQNAVEPNKAFCAMFIISNNEKGMATKSFFLEDVVDDPDVGRHYAQQHFNATVQLSFIGEGCGDMAYSLKQALKTSILMKEDFLKEDISILDSTAVRSNPQLRETHWVDGFTMDITMAYSVQSTEDLNWVEFITVNGIQYPAP